jgi:hypothetical protein
MDGEDDNASNFNHLLLCFSSVDFNLPKVIPASDGCHHELV